MRIAANVVNHIFASDFKVLDNVHDVICVTTRLGRAKRARERAYS